MRYSLIIGLLFLVACNQQKKETNIKPPPLLTDYLTDKASLRDVILKFDAKRDSFVFDKNFKPTKLSNIELQRVEALIIMSATKYNKGKNYTIKEVAKYYKQIIPVINLKGQKEVWVNCLCKVPDDDWKKRVINVNDGGTCYFNLKINLTTNTIYDFSINGVG